MTLWIFGDSFAHMAGQNGSYASRILDAFPSLGNIKEHGWCSTALGYTYEKWESNRDKFEKDDLAIIVITSLGRKYFFPDMPGWSYPSGIEQIPNYTASDQQKKAFNLYYKYLRRSTEENIGLINFLHAVQDTGIKSVILPAFPDSEEIIESVRSRFTRLMIASGNLHDIARGEVAPEVDYPNAQEMDRRNNHICRSNHVILANKIIAAITGENHIDLKRDFLRNIVTRERLEDKDWRSRELTDPGSPI